MRGKWLLVGGGAIFLAIGAGALSLWRKSTAEPVKKAAPAPESTLQDDEIILAGKIQAAHVVPVAAPIDGTLETWEVETGQEVLEGQPLGHIRNSSLESDRELAESELERARNKATALEGAVLAARLEAARTEAEASRAKSEASRLEKTYQRQQMLFREGAAARLDFEKAEKAYRAASEESKTASEMALQMAERAKKIESDLQSAKAALEERNAELESAKEEIEAGTILAPADGAVIKLGVEPGAEVSRTMADLVQIAVDPGILHIVVEPEPAVLALIKPGLPALVLVPDIMAEALSGEVKQVRDTQVVVEFSSPNPAVKHGINGSVRIRLR